MDIRMSDGSIRRIPLDDYNRVLLREGAGAPVEAWAVEHGTVVRMAAQEAVEAAPQMIPLPSLPEPPPKPDARVLDAVRAALVAQPDGLGARQVAVAARVSGLEAAQAALWLRWHGYAESFVEKRTAGRGRPTTVIRLRSGAPTLPNPLPD